MSSTYQLNYDTPKFTINSFDHPSFKTKPDIRIEDELQSWVLNFKVSHNCVNNLLSILNFKVLNLPNDVQTLMKTQKLHEISNIGNGNYIHLGLKKHVTAYLNTFS